MTNTKVLELIKKMMGEPERIRNVEKAPDYGGASSNEYYFTYPETRYLWSISEVDSGAFYFFYYPDSADRSNFLSFTDTELGEASKPMLKKLHQLVESKLFGFDDVLNELLK